ncbi:acyl carrier protein [Nocardia sp. BMG51109]|uniref:acyl carrier protein n=1 Tax=Nocardia sp. BMG51109 TaxID=1056816 RepID=UPI0004653E36|nr:acyl carrier protein [Nocardia sp. BMG51109]
MDRNLIRQRVVRMLSDTLSMSADELDDERIDLRDDLGMDSIDFVDLIELLEAELGRTVEREQLAGVRTIGNVVDMVHELATDVIAPGTAQ